MNDAPSYKTLRILVVEDNQDINENIAEYFEPMGHVLDFALNGLGGLHLALTAEYDVMILDIMLPGMDGFTVCKTLRESVQKGNPAGGIPILMLTARDTLPDKIEGFTSGTDDYLIKPFALRELDVRLQALVKRRRGRQATVLKVADVELCLDTMTVFRAKEIIELNKTCIQILELLMRSSPNVITRNALEYALWGDSPPGSDALRSHMYLLRKKIDKRFSRPLIRTVHGIGYKMAVTNEI